MSEPENGWLELPECGFCKNRLANPCPDLAHTRACVLGERVWKQRPGLNPFEGQGPVFVVDPDTSFRDPISGRIYCGRKVWNTLTGILNDGEDSGRLPEQETP